jgi:hypothetical protein
MSKQQRKHAHNPRNPNLCRVCLTNTIGKTRLAYGHTVCQACAKREEPKPTSERFEKCGEVGCSFCDNGEMPNE